MADDFRLKSVHFSQLPWKTSVLYRPGGLQELKNAHEISVRSCTDNVSVGELSIHIRHY
jgi:hypothetical protein